MALLLRDTVVPEVLLASATLLKTSAPPSHMSGTTMARSATSHTMRLSAVLAAGPPGVLRPLLLLVTTRQYMPVLVDLMTTASPGSTRSAGLAAFWKVNCSLGVLPSPALAYAADEKLSTLTVSQNTFLML
jgi:hypothetical protein